MLFSDVPPHRDWAMSDCIGSNARLPAAKIIKGLKVEKAPENAQPFRICGRDIKCNQTARKCALHGSRPVCGHADLNNRMCLDPPSSCQARLSFRVGSSALLVE